MDFSSGLSHSTCSNTCKSRTGSGGKCRALSVKPLYAFAGAWRFEVQGKDAAGNAAAQELLAEWTVDMDSGLEYARIAAGPFGPTANTTAQFSLMVRRLHSLFQ